MAYEITTYEYAKEAGAADYSDEFESLEQLPEVVKRAEDYGMVLTELNVMEYIPDSDGSDYNDLGSLQEVLDTNRNQGLS